MEVRQADELRRLESLIIRHNVYYETAFNLYRIKMFDRSSEWTDWTRLKNLRVGDPDKATPCETSPLKNCFAILDDSFYQPGPAVAIILPADGKMQKNRIWKAPTWLLYSRKIIYWSVWAWKLKPSIFQMKIHVSILVLVWIWSVHSSSHPNGATTLDLYTTCLITPLTTLLSTQ